MNQSLIPEKIHMHVIDGTDVWIPVGAERQADNHFLILPFDDFDPDDSSVVPQFIPGDIVACTRKRKDNLEFEAAESLIKPSDSKDRVYFEFLYRTLTGDKLSVDKEKNKYKDAILRTKREIHSGKFHYQAIVEYINGIGTF